MKRAAYIIALVFITAVVFSSCIVQRCPAYGQQETELQDLQG